MESYNTLERAQAHKCPKTQYLGAKDIIADIDIDEDGNFTYKGRKVDNLEIKYLSDGTFGVVKRISFTLQGAEHFFALKQFRPDKKYGTVLAEATVMEKHTSSVSCPGVISMKVRQYEGHPAVIMPLADSDLSQHTGKFSDVQAQHIVTTLQQALLCFYNNGDYYYDIKPANILYNCHGDISTFFLGDMGSLLPINGYYMSTYPPPEFSNGHIKDVTNALKHYAYMLSCLYCALVSGEFCHQCPRSANQKVLAIPPYKCTRTGYVDKLKRLAATTKRIVGDSNRYIELLELIANILENGVPRFEFTKKGAVQVGSDMDIDLYLDYVEGIDNLTEWPL